MDIKRKNLARALRMGLINWMEYLKLMREL